ncbi:rhomboid family intramembrane serine protease [Pseudidiomarina homiensis]|uniref:rhomboid family intramembrane serine protease n=1 Tax=Pseudidiomarina homiensis TaxID=364198 RepID=UPI00215A5F70|nr:rhomboid family intramembrane serine protease [Pseudidiomarina homiensis]
MFRLQLPLSPTYVIPPLALAVILACAMLLPADVRQTLLLSRTDFHWYTLFSAQLLHHSWSHLALNLGGILLWWALFAESIPQKRYWLLLPLVMVVSSLAEWALNGEFSVFSGFSGTLYGLFAYSGVTELRQRKLIGSLVLVALSGKLIFDLLYPQYASGVAVHAHIGGALIGSAIAFLRPNRSL